MTGTGRRQLLTLADQLSDRDLKILKSVDRFRLLQADQLRRLLFHEISSKPGSARICRRSLARLVDAGLLHRLERRVGGVRAGSSGHIYATTAAGKRLLAYRAGHGARSDRGSYEPSAAFVAHTLAIANLYLELVEIGRDGGLELIKFETEPDCWRSYTTGFGGSSILKPDAYVQLADADYEYANFVEIDLATAGRQALVEKLRSYLAYHRSGREQTRTGWFPRVVWITTSAPRALFIATLVKTLPPPTRTLFAVGTATAAIELLLGTAGQPSSEGVG